MEKRKIERGKPLTEMVKGSYEYTIHLVRRAFYRQFQYETEEEYLWIEDTLADFVIVSSNKLPVDEFYYVTYTREGEAFVFASREAWEVVELAYRFKTTSMAESKGKKQGAKRFEERIHSSLEFAEAETGESPDGPWQIQGHGITADVVNGNYRRYAGYVIEAAIRKLKGHLHESAGQGRLVLTGESDHPTDKGNRVPLLQETIINWNEVDFDGQKVLIEGNLLGTRIGKDTRAQMKGGVRPDISQRGYGRSIIVVEDDQEIEEVIELTITGYDLVANGADPEAGVTMVESIQAQESNQKPIQSDQEEPNMDEMTLEALRAKYPQLVAQIEAERDKTRRLELEAQLEARRREDERIEQEVEKREAALRKELGLGPDDDLVEALRQREAKAKAAEEARQTEQAELKRLQGVEQQRQVEAHIAEAVKGLKYPEDVKKTLLEAMVAARPQTVEDADKMLESKRKEYDALMSQLELAKRGFSGALTTAPVIESELGIPAFARPSYELIERLTERRLAKRRDLREHENETPNEHFTRHYLAAFDRAYRDQLIEENRRFEAWNEAETTGDLNLPYSVSRTVIEEAFPELIALSIFDFGLDDANPTRLYFESYEGESGSAPTITGEAFTSDADTWVALGHKRLRGSTVTVTSNPAGTTYTEYVDYVIDYGNGKIMVLSAGDMSDATSYLINYTYDAVREGENKAIQRGKGTLSYQTIEMVADRLASLVTDEAVTFARSQLGWDAVTRTLNMIIREIREMIDSHVMRLALASALRAANNGGTWTYGVTEAKLDELVLKLGTAKVAVMNDHYMPGFFLLSLSNAEILSNWKGFTRDGFPDAVLNSAGFVGAVKGLPVFQSPQFPDSHALTGHRELVQHRVFSSKPMTVKGPFQAYSDGKLVAAQEYYAEEYNATESLLPNKGGFVTIA